jgi:hypothetical protein
MDGAASLECGSLIPLCPAEAGGIKLSHSKEAFS